MCSDRPAPKIVCNPLLGNVWDGILIHQGNVDKAHGCILLKGNWKKYRIPRKKKKQMKKRLVIEIMQRVLYGFYVDALGHL